VIGAFFDWLRRLGRGRDVKSGRRGEDLAHRYLKRRGFVIVARNYRPVSSRAEVDLIARDGDALVFVEVKSRVTDEYGEPERAIGEAKRRNLLRAAREYARKTNTPWEQVRFDVVTVILQDPPTIRWYPGWLATSRRT